MKKVDIYSAADKAIQLMNRDMLRDFGKLKTSKMDEIRIIRSVTTLYREQAKKARKRYYEIGFEAFLIGLYFCGISGQEAHRMAEKAITLEWVDGILDDVDLVTGFRFNAETDRKAQRLGEALVAEAEKLSGSGESRPDASGKDAEIDKAVRAWSKQVGQYALGVTDAALMEAYEAAKIPEVRWVSVKDNRRCTECRERDGKLYPLNEVPPKPHWGCRCRVVPAGAVTEEEA